MLILVPFEQRARVPDRGPILGPPVRADVRLCALFEASQSYVRRRRLRRRLQAAVAMSVSLPISALVWQERFTPALVNATIAAWATLFALMHLVVVSEWVCSRRIVEASDELLEGVGRRPVSSDTFLGSHFDESD
jgi:hypothetical protein